MDELFWLQNKKGASPTYCLKVFRVGDVGALGNRIHTINIWGLEVSNLDFQPNLTKDNFYSIATWHPCTLSTEIFPSLDLAEN